jgi:hypothetical protein
MSYKKVDSNQKEIVEALRKAGASVQSLASIGKGCPDLLVAFRGENFLLEVKSFELAELTPDELAWHAGWVGQVSVVRTLIEAFRAVGVMGKPISEIKWRTYERQKV